MTKAKSEEELNAKQFFKQYAMLSFKEEQEMKNKGLLQKRREGDATKKRRRRAIGPGEEDQIDEDLPQPNTAYSTSMQESPVLKSGVHPSNRIRQIIKKRQIVRQMDKPQAWAQGGGGYSTRPESCIK
jgi:hypothetical protein